MKILFIASLCSAALSGATLFMSILNADPALIKSPYEMRPVTVSVGNHVLYKGPKYGVDIYQDQGFKRIDILGGIFYSRVVDSYTAGTVTVKFNDGGY